MDTNYRDKTFNQLLALAKKKKCRGYGDKSLNRGDLLNLLNICPKNNCTISKILKCENDSNNKQMCNRSTGRCKSKKKLMKLYNKPKSIIFKLVIHLQKIERDIYYLQNLDELVDDHFDNTYYDYSISRQSIYYKIPRNENITRDNELIDAITRMEHHPDTPAYAEFIFTYDTNGVSLREMSKIEDIILLKIRKWNEELWYSLVSYEITHQFL